MRQKLIVVHVHYKVATARGYISFTRHPSPVRTMTDRSERRYWLVKSEPDTFSFADLVASPKSTSGWRWRAELPGTQLLRTA